MESEKTTSPVASHRLVVRAEEAGKRLDVLLAEHIPQLSRRRARALIAAGAVSIDRRRVLVQSRPVAAGAEVVCHLQSFASTEPAALEPSRIVHEDEMLLAIDKPSGTPSHPTFARKSDTALQLAEELLRRRERRKVPLWPLHRLDTATSGLLLFAKTQAAGAPSIKTSPADVWPSATSRSSPAHPCRARRRSACPSPRGICARAACARRQGSRHALPCARDDLAACVAGSSSNL